MMQQSRPLIDVEILALELWVAPTAIVGLLYGVHLVLCTSTIHLFLSKGLKSRAHIALFIITVFTMISSTTITILDIWFKIIQLSLRGYNPPDLAKTLILANNVSLAKEYIDRLNFLISDGIVVWRAWILFPRSRKVKILLILCMIISIVGTLLEAAFITSRALGIKDFKLSQRHIYLMPISLLITNATATMLIGYKAWFHQKDVKKNLESSESSGVLVAKILTLLTESGIIYCVLWIIYATISICAPDAENNLAYGIYGSALPDLSAIYPILIILLAARENSKEGNRENLTLSQSIRFASIPQAMESDEGSSLGETSMKF